MRPWVPDSLPLATMLSCLHWEGPGAAGLALHRSFSPRLVTHESQMPDLQRSDALGNTIRQPIIRVVSLCCVPHDRKLYGD